MNDQYRLGRLGNSELASIDLVEAPARPHAPPRMLGVHTRPRPPIGFPPPAHPRPFGPAGGRPPPNSCSGACQATRPAREWGRWVVSAGALGVERGPERTSQRARAAAVRRTTLAHEEAAPSEGESGRGVASDSSCRRVHVGLTETRVRGSTFCWRLSTMFPWFSWSYRRPT